MVILFTISFIFLHLPKAEERLCAYVEFSIFSSCVETDKALAAFLPEESEFTFIHGPGEWEICPLFENRGTNTFSSPFPTTFCNLNIKTQTILFFLEV